MAISHVLRGEEWLSSTPKHLLLYRALGWAPPAFAHLPLLLRPDRTKLSKRTSDAFVSSLNSKGMLPAAVLNFVALLGWTPADGRELFLSVAELAAAFDLPQLHRAGAVVDMQKLSWIQRAHMRALSPATVAEPAALLAARLRNAGQASGAADAETCARIVLAGRNTFATLADLADASGYFFSEDFQHTPAYSQALAKVILSAVRRTCVT